MKNKIKNQRLFDIFYKTVSSSPYWDWAFHHCYVNEDGEILEVTQANPDNLSEGDSYYRASDDSLSRFQRLKKIFKYRLNKIKKKLSKEHIQIMLYLSEGLSVRSISKKLRIPKSSVQDEIAKIRKMFGQS